MSNISILADRYGELKTQIEELQAQLKSVHTEIVATGTDRIVGDHFMVMVNLRKNTEFSEEKIQQTFGVSLKEFEKMTKACKVEKDPSVVVSYESRF